MTNFYLHFSRQRLGAIDRQWIRANFMKQNFDRLLPNEAPLLNTDFERYFIGEVNSFMYTWYGYLFSVLEATADGIRKHIDTDMSPEEAVQKLCDELRIEKDFYNAWKKTRNTTFHIRSDYYDKDMFAVITAPGAGDMIRRIHAEVETALLEAMRNNAP